MTQADFETFLNDPTKSIGDHPPRWTAKPNHPALLFFHADFLGESAEDMFLEGSWNRKKGTVSFTICHRGTRSRHGRMGQRVYSLDLGVEHPNPDKTVCGSPHKHRWKEDLRLYGFPGCPEPCWGDEEAYVPTDITATVADPAGLWREFCAEAGIIHTGPIVAA